MSDTQSTAAARQAKINDLGSALNACSYIQQFLRSRTPADADEARQHVAAFDWLSQFGAGIERDYKAAIAAAPLGEVAAAVKAAEPSHDGEDASAMPAPKPRRIRRPS